jgi:hypothetical protein
MDQTNIDWPALQAGFVPRWRVQSAKNGNAICVPYIDARAVATRLDEVMGASQWQNHYDPTTGLATIGILIDGDWVFKSDVGEDSKVSAIKGRASDAFKRAAVVWGIGRDLYAMGTRVLKSSDGKHPETDKGTMLYTGDQLSNYLNGMSENMGLILQIWKRNPSLQKDQRFLDALTILKEIL